MTNWIDNSKQKPNDRELKWVYLTNDTMEIDWFKVSKQEWATYDTDVLYWAEVEKPDSPFASDGFKDITEAAQYAAKFYKDGFTIKREFDGKYYVSGVK